MEEIIILSSKDEIIIEDYNLKFNLDDFIKELSDIGIIITHKQVSPCG